MKRLNYSKKTLRYAAIFALIFLPVAADAQISTSDGAINSSQRPKLTDGTSHKLIRNCLAASGGKQAYIDLKNVVATGTITEARNVKKFHLIEMQDGRRQLTYEWTFLGRKYKTRYSYDGVATWEQVLLPKEKPAENMSGRDAVFFAKQHWLIQPFIVPLKANYVFKYQGVGRVGGRSSYVITGFGKNNVQSWFYFDKEKSLLTRWGGKGTIAGIEEDMDYRASSFGVVNGVLLPNQISLLAQGSPFGSITFDKIEANQAIDTKIFYMPPSNIPTLIQRPIR